MKIQGSKSFSKSNIERKTYFLIIFLCNFFLFFAVFGFKLVTIDDYIQNQAWLSIGIPGILILFSGVFSFPKLSIEEKLISYIRQNNFAVETIFLSFVFAIIFLFYGFKPIHYIGQYNILLCLTLGFSSSITFFYLILSEWQLLQDRLKEIALKYKNNAKSINSVLLLFLALVILKIFLYNYENYYYFTNDELIYTSNAYKFFTGKFFTGTLINGHYPPLYPILLSFAFLSKGNYFQNELVLNAIYSSLTIIMTYALARKYVDKKYTYICVILASLLPFQLSVTRSIYSENIYIPFLLFSLYLSLKEKKGVKATVFFGIILACLYLTRYISFIVLPVCIIIWLLGKFKNLSFYQVKQQLLILLVIILLIYGLWIIYGLSVGFPLRGLLGFHISESPNHEQLTIKRLIYWCVINICSIILIISPFLFPIFISIKTYFPNLITLIKKKKTYAQIIKTLSKENILIIAFLGIISVFGIASIRFFWQEGKNFPEITYFFTRYLVFLTPLSIIPFVIGLSEIKNQKKKINVLLFVLSSGLILISYFVCFKINLLSNPAINSQILRTHASLDIAVFISKYNYFYLLAILITPIFLFLGRKMEFTYIISICLICISLTIINYQEVLPYESGYVAIKTLKQYLDKANMPVNNISLYYQEEDVFWQKIIAYNGDLQIYSYWALLDSSADFRFLNSAEYICEDISQNMINYGFFEKQYQPKSMKWIPIEEVSFSGTTYGLFKINCGAEN